MNLPNFCYSHSFVSVKCPKLVFMCLLSSGWRKGYIVWKPTVFLQVKLRLTFWVSWPLWLLILPELCPSVTLQCCCPGRSCSSGPRYLSRATWQVFTNRPRAKEWELLWAKVVKEGGCNSWTTFPCLPAGFACFQVLGHRAPTRQRGRWTSNSPYGLSSLTGAWQP